MALCPLIQKITREIYGSIQAERSIVIRTLPNPTHSVVKCASLQSDGFLYPLIRILPNGALHTSPSKSQEGWSPVVVRSKQQSLNGK